MPFRALLALGNATLVFPFHYPVKQIFIKICIAPRDVSGNSYPNDPSYFIAVNEYFCRYSICHELEIMRWVIGFLTPWLATSRMFSLYNPGRDRDARGWKEGILHMGRVYFYNSQILRYYYPSLPEISKELETTGSICGRPCTCSPITPHLQEM